MILTRTGTLLLTLLAVIVFPLNSQAREAARVDWLNGYVSTTSSGYAKITGSPADAENAIAAARVVALGNLLEAVKGVHVDRQTEIGDLMAEQTQTAVRVQGVIRNAVQVGEPLLQEEKGFVTATVEMRVCLQDGKECQMQMPLAEILPKQITAKKNNRKPDACSLLPNLADHRNVLQKGLTARTGPPESIIVNLKGKPFDTASRDLIIGFIADDGQRCALYAPAKVEPTIRKDRGMAELLLHLPRSSDKNGVDMFSVLATSVETGNYILVNRDDAYLISLFNDSAKNSIFSQGKIAIALDD